MKNNKTIKIPDDTGEIKGMTTFKGRVIIACSNGVFELVDYNLERIEVKQPETIHPVQQDPMFWL